MPVGDVNFWLDVGPSASTDARVYSRFGSRVLRVTLRPCMLEEIGGIHRMHTRAGRPSEPSSRDLDHSGDDRRVRIDLHRSVVFVVVHLFCVARDMPFALDTGVEAGVVSTYLSGAFIFVSRHRSRDDALRRREGQQTAIKKEGATACSI